MKACPTSSTSFWFNLCACLIALLFTIITTWLHWTDELQTQTIAALCSFLLINICWKFYKQPVSLHLINNWSDYLKRIATKSAASYACVFACLFIYWLFPLYHTVFYQPFFELLNKVLPYWLVFTPFYIAITDLTQQDPYDTYWLLGSWLFRNTLPGQGKAIIKLSTAWLVKVFFTPLMITFITQQFTYFHSSFDLGQADSLLAITPPLIHIIFMIDCLIGTAGYIFTFQLINTDIISTDPTFFGWAIALICYPPFETMLKAVYINYIPNQTIEYWFLVHPAAMDVLMILALYCIVLYVLATVAFGIRFSNLTYRGLISCGPYRHTKHPAYFYKNIFWWLTAIPFIFSQSAGGTIRSMVLLMLFNAIYFMRAKTEERHLSRYPEYREYAAYIEERGLYAFLGRWMPWLKFNGKLLNLKPERHIPSQCNN